MGTFNMRTGLYRHSHYSHVNTLGPVNTPIYNYV